MVWLLIFKKNMYINHKELVDQVSAKLIRETRKLESRKSWLAMRNYLYLLSDEQLQAMLKEPT